jgi:hypothetical protein
MIGVTNCGQSALLAGILLLAAAATAAARPLLAERRNATDYIRWYVAELPAEYRMEHKRLWGYDFLHGQLLPSTAEATNAWRTNWEHIDYWIYNQMLVSPRRVHDPYDCDVVVVPFGPRFTHFNTTWRRFMENADKLLPLLSWKPHIIVAYQPAFMWVARSLSSAGAAVAARLACKPVPC